MRQFIIHKATQNPKRVVFGEGEEPKIIRAAAQIIESTIGIPILLGRPDIIQARAEELGIENDFTIIYPPEYTGISNYAETYSRLRDRKGITITKAERIICQNNILGPMMVLKGEADVFISGLTYEYPEVIRPALQLFHTREGVNRGASLYLMIVDDRVYIFADATVNIDPSAEDLVETA